MRNVVTSEKYGQIVVEESFWTGKKKLYINGEELVSVVKNSFLYKTEEKNISVRINGNFLLGVSISIEDEVITVTEKTKWYEFMLAILPFIFVIIWGNVPDLFDIFPVVSGAIGGLITIAFAYLNIGSMKSTKNPLYKLLIGLGIGIASIFVCYLIAIAIIG